MFGCVAGIRDLFRLFFKSYLIRDDDAEMIVQDQRSIRSSQCQQLIKFRRRGVVCLQLCNCVVDCVESSLRRCSPSVDIGEPLNLNEMKTLSISLSYLHVN